MTDRQLRALLNLFMCSDPWPASDDDIAVIEALITTEVAKRGFPDWIEAYHSMAVNDD